MPVRRWAHALGLACAVVIGAVAAGGCGAQPAPAAPGSGAWDPVAVAALRRQVDTLQGRVDALDNLAVALRTLAARVGRLQRLQQARADLDDGRPLGDIPGAPPALARFANTAPPTMASLRAAFPAAARAARRASQGPASSGLLGGAWRRMAALVTVRDGDRILVGAPAARTLADAGARLDAGDLPATLAALDRLDPAAKQAMADWTMQADALLAARAEFGSGAR